MTKPTRLISKTTSERGAILPLVALGLAGVTLGVLLLGITAKRVIARSDCQSAADSSALAGVAENRSSAVELAAVNGGTLITYSEQSGQVRVLVECNSIRASAVAERELVKNRQD